VNLDIFILPGRLKKSMEHKINDAAEYADY